MMQRVTTLGFSERAERVLAYLFLWVSGLFLFFFEKNQNVRWHAAQSLLTFGTLSVLMFAISVLRDMLSYIPLLGWITGFGLGLLYFIILWINIGLWVWLMFNAWIRPDYRLPIVSNWVRYLV